MLGAIDLSFEICGFKVESRIANSSIGMLYFTELYDFTSSWMRSPASANTVNIVNEHYYRQNLSRFECN